MIRTVGIDELDALEDAAHEFYAASRFLGGAFSISRFREIWQSLLGTGAGVIFADYCGEGQGVSKIAGTIGGIVHREIYGEEMIAEEFFWFVREGARGSGVRLYRKFEEWARKQGAVRIQMAHLRDSMPEKVGKFYLHTGFELAEMRFVKALTNGNGHKTMKGYRVFDDFLPDPEAWRAAALALEYKTLTFGDETHHGIAIPESGEVPLRIMERFPGAVATLSFFRKSPEGQEEPLYIHTDVGMGEWSAILYLNPDPPAGDGTVFWEHLATGARESAIVDERAQEGRTADGWKPWRTIEARFNRLVVFPSTYFHSRAIFDNWGAGSEARLTQVVFGKGDLRL